MQRAAENVLSVHSQDAIELVDSLFLATLSRKPSAAERDVAIDLLGAPITQTGVEDVLWAVFMLPEFHLIR